MNKLPLLALCGLLNDERLWHAQAQALGRDHPFTIVPSVDHDNVAALAREALARAPAPRFALAGFSLGGYVALEIMRQAPARVAGLALVDTGAREDTPEQIEFRQRAIAAAQPSSVSGELFAAFLPRVVHPDHLGDLELVALLRSMGEAVGVPAFVRQQTAAMNRPDSRGDLAAIACPTLVACGREDQITPPALSEEMASRIPGARLVVVPGSGHMLPLEQPAALSRAMREWLTTLD